MRPPATYEKPDASDDLYGDELPIKWRLLLLMLDLPASVAVLALEVLMLEAGKVGHRFGIGAELPKVRLPETLISMLLSMTWYSGTCW